MTLLLLLLFYFASFCVCTQNFMHFCVVFLLPMVTQVLCNIALRLYFDRLQLAISIKINFLCHLSWYKTRRVTIFVDRFLFFFSFTKVKWGVVLRNCQIYHNFWGFWIIKIWKNLGILRKLSFSQWRLLFFFHVLTLLWENFGLSNAWPTIPFDQIFSLKTGAQNDWLKNLALFLSKFKIINFIHERCC